MNSRKAIFLSKPSQFFAEIGKNERERRSFTFSSVHESSSYFWWTEMNVSELGSYFWWTEIKVHTDLDQILAIWVLL